MRILLAVDGSPSADLARDLVAGLAWPEGTLVRVVAALDIGPALWGGPWIPAVPADADLLEDVAVRELSAVLERAREPLVGAGLAVEVELLRGSPRLTIPEEAKLWQPDLTVLGSRGHGPIESALLGLRLVGRGRPQRLPGPRRPRRPRLPCRARRGRLRGRRSPPATCSSAGRPSPRSRSASWAWSTWPPRGGAASPRRMFGAAMDIYADMLASTRTTVEQLVAATVERLRAAGRTAEGEVREGDPAGEIVRAVSDLPGDLVVVGSRGHVGLSRLVLGSVAHSVLLHAHCSVMVVRRPHDRR